MSRPHVDVDQSGNDGSHVTVKAGGFPPNHWITFFISLHGKTVAEKKTKTDSNGRASEDFTIHKKGSYLAVATSSGLAAAEGFHIAK